MTLQNTPQIAI